MSKFLDDLFDNLEKPENETPEEVATEANEVEAIEPEVEETTETDEGDSEEVSETEAVEEASETTEAEDDDDGEELPPAERKAYGRLKALIDEREKRQAADEARKSAEAERDRLNLELAEMRRQQQEAASQALPDPYSDPQGYAAAREAQFEEQLTRQKLPPPPPPPHSALIARQRRWASKRWRQRQTGSKTRSPKILTCHFGRP